MRCQKAELKVRERRMAAEEKHLLKVWLKQQKDKERHRENIMQVALILLVWTCPSMELPMLYMDRKLGCLNEEDPEAIKDELSHRYLNTDLEVLNDIETGAALSLSPRLFAEARRFRDEAEMHDWIKHQNEQQGCAPSPSLALAHRRGVEHSQEVKSLEGAKDFFAAGEVKWMQRFRKRWGLSVGSMPKGEVQPLETVRSKAHASDRKWETNVSFGGPVKRQPAKKWYRILVPKNVTTFHGGNRKWARQTVHLFSRFSLSGSLCVARVAFFAVPDARGKTTLAVELG